MPLPTDLTTDFAVLDAGHTDGHNTTNARVNAIAAEVNTHETASDPHGDRAYVDNALAVVAVSDYATAGAADSTSGIAAAMTAASALTIAAVPDTFDGAASFTRRARVVFGRGVWNTTATITIPPGVNVELTSDAVVRAASVGTMGPVFDTELDVIHQNGQFACHGLIDCANKASSGIYLRSFAGFELRHPEVLSPTSHGIILGDSASAARAYEGYLLGAKVWRPNGAALVTGAAGIYVQHATDCHIGGPNSLVVGFDIGVRNGSTSGNNTFSSVHVWGYPPNDANGNDTTLLPSVAFLDETVASLYFGCYVDNADTYGWHFTGGDPQALISGCRAYYGAIADNTSTVVQVDASLTPSVTVVGLQISGEAGHRPAADFGGTLNGTVRIGTRASGVVAPVGDALAGAAAEVYPDVHDRFVGTDGAAPSTAKWTVTSGGAAAAEAVLNSNRLRLTTGATGSYASADTIAAAAALGGNVVDAELLALVEYGNPANESYVRLGVRATTAAVNQGTGYGVETSGQGGFVGLNKYVAGTPTGLYFVSGFSLGAGVKRWFRLRVQGDHLSLWHWAYGDPAPVVPTFEVDDTAVSAAGLVSVSHGGGAAAVSGVAYIRQATVFVLP